MSKGNEPFLFPLVMMVFPTNKQQNKLVRRDHSLSYHCYSPTNLIYPATSHLQFNHRLKDIFMTAARNFVRYNPDSHLAGYFKNLVKKRGMKANEAYKRVARALVRVIFRKLRALIEEKSTEQKWSENDMAGGSDFRSDISHVSNISLSTPNEDDNEQEGKIKRGESNSSKEKRALVEKM